MAIIVGYGASLGETLDEGFSAAVTSYVGKGTSSRNITLSLNGSAPVFAIVVPTNASAKAYRVTGNTTGRNTATGNALANSPRC